MKQLLTLFLIFICFGCAVMKPLQIPDTQYRNYKPIEPIPVKNVEVYTNNGFVTKPWASLTDSAIRDMLPNQSAQIAMRTNDLTGRVNYLTASITGQVGTYEVIMDYMKYRIEDVYAQNEVVGSGRVGIGLRVNAKVITNKANLNLSSLTNLGLEASNNHLTGLLSIDIIGIDSKDITNYIPLTAKLDETSIQSALQAIATIKSKIWDKNVKITPQLIAINQSKDSAEKIIKEKIAGTYSYTNTSDMIFRFWKPNGTQVDSTHQELIKKWMSANGLDISITYFINTNEMELYRQKIISDLKLDEK